MKPTSTIPDARTLGEDAMRARAQILSDRGMAAWPEWFVAMAGDLVEHCPDDSAEQWADRMDRILARIRGYAANLGASL